MKFHRIKGSGDGFRALSFTESGDNESWVRRTICRALEGFNVAAIADDLHGAGHYGGPGRTFTEVAGVYPTVCGLFVLVERGGLDI